MIYLASPYSDPDPAVREARFEAAVRATADLALRGLVVYSPIVHWHSVAVRCKLPTGWAFYAAQDLPMLSRASEVWVLCLDGWKDSTGVQAELAAAREIGVPVRHLRPGKVGKAAIEIEVMEVAL